MRGRGETGGRGDGLSGGTGGGDGEGKVMRSDAERVTVLVTGIS